MLLKPASLHWLSHRLTYRMNFDIPVVDFQWISIFSNTAFWWISYAERASRALCEFAYKLVSESSALDWWILSAWEELGLWDMSEWREI